MKRGTLAPIACPPLVSAAGCGSSSKTPPGSGAGAPGVAGGVAGSAPAPGTEVFGEPGEKTQTTPSAVVHPTGPVTQISYRNVAIAPAKVTVKAGTTIVWTNADS